MKDMKLKTKIIIAAAAVLLVAVIVCLTAFACNNNIYNGISVAGVDIGGLTVDAAAEKLADAEFFATLPAFVCGDREFEISPKDIGLKCDELLTSQAAHAYGRDVNVFVRIGNIFNLMFNPVDLPMTVTYDDAALDAEFDKYIGDLRTPSVEPVIRLEGDKLYIKNGSQGVDVNKVKLNSDFAAVAAGKTDKIQVVIETVNPTPISAQGLHDQYAQEMVNAEYTISNMRITYTDSADGIDFDIAAAEQIINDNLSNAAEYYIPLTIVKPEMTVEQLNASMFGDCLGTYTTKYNPGEIGRTKNVTLAAQNINNVVLQSGEVFSYNQTVGERTAARGFAGAKVYSGGEVVDGLGGGICQVSSTLYNAVLYADLEIISRTEHSLPVTYVPLGRDATVAYGAIDFKFKNQYESPVKVTSVIGGGQLTISIYGKKTSDKTVELYTERISTIPFSTVEKPDESIAEGTTKVKQSGSNGAVVNTYKKIIENGTVVSNKMIHTSRYSPINKVVLVPPVPEIPAEEAPSAEQPIVDTPPSDAPVSQPDPTEGYPVNNPPSEVVPETPAVSEQPSQTPVETPLDSDVPSDITTNE